MDTKQDKIIKVDLNTESIQYMNLPSNSKDFLGGRGVGVQILKNEIKNGDSPLSPQNPLIFSTGPMTGTPAPASGRLSLVTMNAINNGICFSNGGGHFAPELRYSGIEHLVIVGHAKRPIYLFIKDGQIEFRDAGKLWGKDTWETDQIIKSELKDTRTQILSIGPTGENLSLMACIMINNSRALGFGGCGAVMGAKNLKAIAVRGTGSIAPADSEAFMNQVRKANNKIDRSIGTGYLRAGGTINKIGPKLPLPTRNYQDENWEAGKKITTNAFREISDYKRLSCFNCPMYCSHFFSVKEGAYAGLKTEGTQINVVRGLGSLLDTPNAGFILKAGSLANRYGIHVDELAATLSWAAECYEKGLLDKEDIGFSLEWGDEKAFLKLIEMIAKREGFGNILADGVYRAAETVKKNSDKYAMTIKKTGINEGCVRGKKGWALGIATNTRGGGHLGGSPNTEGVASYTESVGEARYGVPQAGNPKTYEGKPKLIFWFERFKAVIDSLGMCYFTSYWQNNLLGPKDYAALLSSFTGIDYTEENLFRIGNDILNMEHDFNKKHAGFNRKDDHFPERFYEEKVSSGPFKGELLKIDEWEKMLDEYYKLHNWDEE
jgi:aldehyde:ferredoxin oxidoreductase